MKQLQSWIKSLPCPFAKTEWSDYTSDRNYDDKAIEQKKQFISEIIANVKPQKLVDVGCNTGEFIESSLNAGAKYAIGLESDHGALDKAYKFCLEKKLNFLPLYMNVSNPSANCGWNEQERNGLKNRADFDFSLGLAVIHHIVISGNIPLQKAIEYFVMLAPRGIIEWVPKSDKMVQKLLRNRKDIFDDYTPENFMSCFKSLTNIKNEKLLDNGRKMIYYEKI